MQTAGIVSGRSDTQRAYKAEGSQACRLAVFAMLLTLVFTCYYAIPHVNFSAVGVAFAEEGSATSAVIVDDNGPVAGTEDASSEIDGSPASKSLPTAMQMARSRYVRLTIRLQTELCRAAMPQALRIRA